ncbi:MAG: ribonuclease D [Paracoccaceae bacterium]
MITITETAALAAFCARAARHDYVTVDTEFLRERTYYAQLCLVQLALPTDDPADAVLVDPLAAGLSLEPLLDLFRDPGVVKVFHAARQDIEIFALGHGVIPAPLFDTQVAAMVCGFGEQVGYETLVRRVANAQIDKSSRYTDWSRRPLSDAQKVYALADVTHLRVVYEHLRDRLEETGRAPWVAEEMAMLADMATYRTVPEDAWRRVKTRNTHPRFLAIVRELAAFRERTAQARDVPRNRVFKDDALVEVASTKPASADDLSGARLLQREARRGEVAEGILAAVARGLSGPAETGEKRPGAVPRDEVNAALADLLRVLLKARTEDAGVASKLIASAADLDALAAGRRDIAALEGWRAQVFGDDAMRLCEGRIALAVDGEAVVTVPRQV